MPDPVDALVLDLLEWIGPRPRPYAEVIAAWRTSCPRLPVWEEANTRGYVDHGSQEGTGATVAVSGAGRAALKASRETGWAGAVAGGAGRSGNASPAGSGSVAADPDLGAHRASIGS